MFHTEQNGIVKAVISVKLSSKGGMEVSAQGGDEDVVECVGYLMAEVAKHRRTQAGASTQSTVSAMDLFCQHYLQNDLKGGK